MASHPSTIGEWDREIATMSEADLLKYRAALATIREWTAFKEAFGWTRMFVLVDSIDQRLDHFDREAAKNAKR